MRVKIFANMESDVDLGVQMNYQQIITNNLGHWGHKMAQNVIWTSLHQITSGHVEIIQKALQNYLVIMKLNKTHFKTMFMTKTQLFMHDPFVDTFWTW